MLNSLDAANNKGLLLICEKIKNIEAPQKLWYSYEKVSIDKHLQLIE